MAWHFPRVQHDRVSRLLLNVEYTEERTYNVMSCARGYETSLLLRKERAQRGGLNKDGNWEKEEGTSGDTKVDRSEQDLRVKPKVKRIRRRAGGTKLVGGEQ